MAKFIRIYDTWKDETAELTLEEKGRLIDYLIDYIRTGDERFPYGNEKYIYPVYLSQIKRENETHDRKKAERAEKRNKNAEVLG